MEQESLERLLDQGLSLAEIGRRFGRHESTVGYWVKKHGLEAVRRQKHTAKGGLSREQLEPLVEQGASIAEIAEAVERSKGTVRHWLKKYELRTSRPLGAPSRSGVERARAEGRSRAPIKCPQHGLTEHVLELRGYYRCRQCRIEAVVRRRQKVKQALVREAGGSCRLCGYHRCLAALEFHHLEPSTKAFCLARCGAHSIEKLRAEASKCILLCSNCHAEVEAGMTRLS